MKAKKHFGQHFLHNQETAYQITQALGPIADKNVLEIGPGLGVLTRFLIKEAQNFKAIEIDKDAAAILRKELDGIDVILADFLKVDIQSLFDSNFHLIGNFPYNISSQIVFRILENSEKIDAWVGMFQLEMGARLIASPKDKKQYGILSVLVPFYYQVEKVMTLPPGAFRPPPKVNSIVLKANRVEHNWQCQPKSLFKVVKTAFNQRRKTLANSLSSIVEKEVLNQHHFANLRPEALKPLDFEELTTFIEAHGNI